MVQPYPDRRLPWAMAFAAAFTGLSVILFAFVSWQTAGYERAQQDAMLRHGRR